MPAAVTGDVVVTGADVAVFDRGGGSRKAYVFPRGGDYHVSVATPSTALPEAPWVPILLVAGVGSMLAVWARRRSRPSPSQH